MVSTKRLFLAAVVLLQVVLVSCSSGPNGTPMPTATPRPTIAASPEVETSPSPETPNSSDRESNRILVSPENGRYLAWKGSIVYPIGNTESGSAMCGGENGWLAISSGFDWQPDLENLLKHGGNYARIAAYFPAQPVQPWLELDDGLYDLSRYNPEWIERLEAYLAWTEAHDIVVQLEVFDNWSFTTQAQPHGWPDNPWNPDKNINYGTEVVANKTSHTDGAIYKVLGRPDSPALGLLEQYVSQLLDVSLPHGNVVYTVSNETSGPLEWSSYWARFMHDYADAKDTPIVVAEMPHATQPKISLEDLVEPPEFDLIDASSASSEDRFGNDDEGAEVEGTDETLTELYDKGEKPITTSKIYYRSPWTLWSKFINGAASARFHRNCDRGGSDEAEPHVYFEYVQHLRTFVDELNLEMASSIDDDVVTTLTKGVHADVLAAPGRWYVVFLYQEANDADASVELTLDLPKGDYNVRWYRPDTGAWIEQTQAPEGPPGEASFTAPDFANGIALLIEVT